MKLDFTINYGAELSRTINGELNVKTLEVEQEEK